MDAELFAMTVALKEAKEVIEVLEEEQVTLVRIISDCMSALDIAVGDRNQRARSHLDDSKQAG